MAAADLVHDPEQYRLPLLRFRFLLGHFRGEGRYTQGTKSPVKKFLNEKRQL
jgi:hypothetical protein